MPDCLSFLDFMIIFCYWMWLLAKLLQISSATLWWELYSCYLLINMILLCSFQPGYYVILHTLQSEEVIDHTLSLFLELASGLVYHINIWLRRTGDVNCLFMHFVYSLKFFLVHDRYMTGKLLLKLDTVKFVVAHHTVIQLIFFFALLFQLHISLFEIFMFSSFRDFLLGILISEGALSIFRRIQMLSQQNNLLLHYWLVDFYGGQSCEI